MRRAARRGTERATGLEIHDTGGIHFMNDDFSLSDLWAMDTSLLASIVEAGEGEPIREIRAVPGAQDYLSTGRTDFVLAKRFREDCDGQPDEDKARKEQARNTPAQSAERRRRALELQSQGKTADEVGQILGISATTTDRYLNRNMWSKLDQRASEPGKG